MSHQGSAERLDIANDARDLRRGIGINLLGYLIKLANPLLNWAVIILYGSRDYGFFLAAQATLMVVLRVCLVGFDKGVLWWAARNEHASPLSGLSSVVVLVSVLSSVTAGVSAVFAPVLADWHGEPEAGFGLRLMGVGLVPMALTELFVSAAAGKRRLAPQVFMRDGVGTVTLGLFGVIFHRLGFGTLGLPMAFVIAKGVACVGALIMVGRLAPFALAAKGQRLPRALVRYSLPFWLSEIASSFAQRMDVLILSAMSSPSAVGVYGAVAQIANTLRQIRQAFDPIVLSIFSEIGKRGDPRRQRAAFSYATSLVVVTQLPVYAFILLFADRLMNMLGKSYAQGTVGVVILAGFWLLNSPIGLNAHIVTGYGRSDLMLKNMLLTIALGSSLLWLLIPSYGIAGITTAVGLAYTVQNLLWVGQAYAITKVWPYDRTVVEVMAFGLLTSLLAAFVYFVVGWGTAPDLARRIATFGVFASVHLLGCWTMHRRTSGPYGVRGHAGGTLWRSARAR